jgi:hypothetical protein
VNTGLLPKLLDTLEIPLCRLLALSALSTVTRHGGGAIRIEVAQKSPILIRLMEEHPDNQPLAELAITIISHAVMAIVGSGSVSGPDKKRLGSVDLPQVFRAVANNIRKPIASFKLINRSIGLFVHATRNCSEYCKASPSVLTLLVATLRSNDIVIRCTALAGLIRLHALEAELDPGTFDPRKMHTCLENGPPHHLMEFMLDYGFKRCDTVVALKTSYEYQEALIKFAKDHDYYTLGMTLVNLILRTEYSIADGFFQTKNPITGELEAADTGLPFTSVVEAMPLCWEAVRERGDNDSADIIQLKYLLHMQRFPEASQISKEAIKRNPEVAYFYYAVSLAADLDDGLRFAKKGMKCKNLTTFLRFQLTYRAINHAGGIGIGTLQSTPETGYKKWEEGVAFLMSAFEDCQAFLDESKGAPPDSRHMNNILYWYILLTITLRGPDMSPDLRELRVSQLKFAATPC